MSINDSNLPTIPSLQAGDVVWVIEREESGVAVGYAGYIFLAAVRSYVLCAIPVGGRIDVDYALHNCAQCTWFNDPENGIVVYPVCDCYETRDEAAHTYEMEL